MAIRVFLRDSPQRAIALATETHVLVFRHSPDAADARLASSTSLNEGRPPKCIVEFAAWEGHDMKDYRSLSSMHVQGTLGLFTLNRDVFLCVVNGSERAATARPGENIQKILSVEFHCLNRSDYDHLLNDQINPFPTDGLDADGFDYNAPKEHTTEQHPCVNLRKLLSGGTFYYSADFDLTKRLQDRPTEANSVAIDSLDAGFLWNTYMIQPLVDFRSRLSQRERDALDESRILTSAIRGFAHTVPVPAASSPARFRNTGIPSTLTLIARLSCRRAGTRFNARGIDDDGNVANFVETETIFCTDTLCFSYVQCRGSVPVFWEQAAGLPGQQKIQITRSVEAAQPAFDKHFEKLAQTYGDVFVVNLLSEEKSGEVQLTRQYDFHIAKSSLNDPTDKMSELETTERKHLKAINYDFHAETRGPNGYEAAKGIKRYLEQSAVAFEHFLSEEISETIVTEGRKHSVVRQNDVLKQAGIFRTNCLDCLDRTNLVQTIISQIAIEIFLTQQGENHPTSDFWARHGILWADCGDTLSKIYAGTGALKSSFTRSGKASIAGAFADFRKSAQRLYINNFEDKGKQFIIDTLLGRQVGQFPVHLFDPINDWVTYELNKRSGEFTKEQSINIWVGTFNLNGKTHGIDEDLSPWLCPMMDDQYRVPEIVAVAFQEIVELDVQQIMSTDPHRRQKWENAVRRTLNANAQKYGQEDYVLLRGGQLVGASLSVFVKASALPWIKNVEGAVKKTGMSGMAGNKGAVAIRMEYADTSICLVTAHLAAGFSNYDERNEDYRTISTGLRFQRNRTIENHDTVIWFGDFNYRIGMENERARHAIKKGDLGQLYENDQLNLQMVHGKCFLHYAERTPSFFPTYKFNIGTDEYDTSEKARIPAWCDRILSLGKGLRQVYYDSAPLKFSDHRPVWGLFNCDINVVDQGKKDRISNDLYSQRRAVVGNHIASQGADSDDESLYGYDSIEPGLPPASSDKRKWWLDNGMPARADVQPLRAGQVPNPTRSSNPFTALSEPDWITVELPNTPPSQVASLYRDVRRPSQASTASKDQPSADMAIQTPPAPPPRPLALDGSADNTGSRTYLKQTLRKPAPPKPTKPSLLQSPSSDSTATTRSVPPSLPEPRRSNVVGSTATRSSNSTEPSKAMPNGSTKTPASDSLAQSTAPKLPPRRPNNALMDDEEVQDLKEWEPLQPH